MTKEEAFDCIVKYHMTVEYHEFLPNGRKNDWPWWIAVSGMNPFVGKTLKGAIGRFAYMQRKALVLRAVRRITGRERNAP